MTDDRTQMTDVRTRRIYTVHKTIVLGQMIPEIEGLRIVLPQAERIVRLICEAPSIMFIFIRKIRVDGQLPASPTPDGNYLVDAYSYRGEKDNFLAYGKDFVLTASYTGLTPPDWDKGDEYPFAVSIHCDIPPNADLKLAS